MLNRNLLTYETGETTHHLPEDSSTAAGFYHLRVQLPQHIMCSQCVLQWRYRTGKKNTVATIAYCKRKTILI